MTNIKTTSLKILSLVILLIMVSSYAMATKMVRAKNNGNEITANMTNLVCTALVAGTEKAANKAICGEIGATTCGSESAGIDAMAGGPEDPAGDAVAAVSFGTCEAVMTEMCNVAFGASEQNVNQMTQSNVKGQVINTCAKKMYTPLCNAFTLGMAQDSCEAKYLNINTNYN